MFRTHKNLYHNTFVCLTNRHLQNPGRCVSSASVRWLAKSFSTNFQRKCWTNDCLSSSRSKSSSRPPKTTTSPIYRKFSGNSFVVTSKNETAFLKFRSESKKGRAFNLKATLFRKPFLTESKKATKTVFCFGRSGRVLEHRCLGNYCIYFTSWDVHLKL